MIIKYVAEEKDPAGIWIVEVSVTDNIRNTTIPLKTQFNLVKDKSKNTAITTLDDFSNFTHLYYLNPQPELIESAIDFLGSSDLASNQNAQAPLLMSFSCLFSQYSLTDKSKWSNKIKKLDDPTKALLTKSINQTPEELLGSIIRSPAKNDMNWACFFATGDTKYLHNVISTLKYMDERKDINLFLTAASAKWSLSSNAKSHSKVRSAIEEIYPHPESIINKEPHIIREEMITILREQKKNGTWK